MALRFPFAPRSRVSSVVLTFLTVAILAACGGSNNVSPPSAGGGAIPGGGTPLSQPARHQRAPDAYVLRLLAKAVRNGKVPKFHYLHRKSWMKPDAGKKWLLYVSDQGTGTVDVYNYQVRTGKLYGQITGFSVPFGECADNAGNVYVVDFGNGNVSEFAHGATTPTTVVNDRFGYPIGCSVDPTTGNVAVTNFASGYYSLYAGSILIFAGGLSGSQSVLTNGYIRWMWPAGYDDNGNLFVEALSYNSSISLLLEVPAGSSHFALLSGLTINAPGAAQWDGFYMTATDTNYGGYPHTGISRFTVSGSSVSVVRTTVLMDDNCNYGEMVAVQPYIGGSTRKLNTVAAGNTECANHFDFWNYANGGNFKRFMYEPPAPEQAEGQTMSPPV
jgi:hypothetical protein